jgi:hypothetical protein
MSLAKMNIITRDQLRPLPMLDLVINYITSLAAAEGFSRGDDPDLGPLQEDHCDDDDDLLDLSMMPTMMNIDNSSDIVQHVSEHYVPPAAGVGEYIRGVVPARGLVEAASGEVDREVVGEVELGPSVRVEVEQRQHLPAQRHRRGVDSLQAIGGARILVVDPTEDDASRAEIRRQLVRRKDWIAKIEKALD